MSAHTNDPRTEAILGAAIEVHRTLGQGFLEKAYHLALEKELTSHGIPFVSEVELPIWYKGQQLATRYRVDLVCFGDILVELKAVAELGRIESAQVINYLAACRKPVGLLLNFGAPVLQIRRLVGPLHFQAQGHSLP